jgi:hypothetical protein
VEGIIQGGRKMDRDQSENLTFEVRRCMRNNITKTAAQFKYAVDKVHNGITAHDDLTAQEKADFAVYYLLINGFPYEYL